MATQKECVERATRELNNDRDFAKRVADRAEYMNFRGFETQIEEGKRLFMEDLEEGE